MPVRFEDLPPSVQEEVLKRAGVAPRRRRPRLPAPALEAVPAEVLGRVGLAPAIAAWAWRKHPRCGWEGIGRCCYCES